MVFVNSNDSMGVDVEVSVVGANAKEGEICDIENEIDYPSQAEVDVARISCPHWLVETLDAQFASPSRLVAGGARTPHIIASMEEAFSSQRNASVSTTTNVSFA
jgi:hypothetical protein